MIVGLSPASILFLHNYFMETRIQSSTHMLCVELLANECIHNFNTLATEI